MSRRRRRTLSPSLFPFLAVLVCTLGTLILLLALVAQNATEAAAESAQRTARRAAEPSEAEPPRLAASLVSEMIQEEQFRVEQLVAVRDQQTADMEQKRDQLTHLEDHISRLQEKLTLLGTEIERATGLTPTNAVDLSALQQLKEEIEEQEALLAALKADEDRQTPRVVIVPHKGPNGTARRPIYIECHGHGVTIWPEGSQISTLQLQDSDRGANPLDAALRAIRYHVAQTLGDQSPPYPLLVVRPDGIESYGAAREAMLDWDDQFGYELIPAELKLAFPTADPKLKERIELAIRRAVMTQHAHHAIASRERASRERLPTLSAATLDRQGRAGGFRSHRDTYASTPPTAPRYASPSAYAGPAAGLSGSGGNPTAGGSSPALRELDEHLRSAADELRRDDHPKLTDSQSDPNSIASGSQSKPSGSTSDPATKSQASAPRINSFASGGEPSVIKSQQPATSDLATRSGPFSQLPGRLSQRSDEADSAAKPTERGGSNENIGREPNESSPSDTAASAGDASRGIDTPIRGSTAETQATGQARTPPPRGALDQPLSLPESVEGDPSEIDERTPPQIAAAQAQSSRVRRSGRDWALPESIAGARGNKIIRTLRVECHPDRFVLLPEASGSTPTSTREPGEPFSFTDGQIDRATLELATAIRDRVDRWGAAIPGGRWQPRLVVDVMPRSEMRFHQLQTLLRGSGLEVQGRTSR